METVETVDSLAELEDRLARYPVERYPIQHATAQFHLGVVLTTVARYDEAETALRRAAELFDPDRLPVEHAKALVALGALLRTTGRSDDAGKRFAVAADLFAAAGAVVEEGAAHFNLGLVVRELGDPNAALERFQRARHLISADVAPAQTAAAARELGATLLALGRFGDAHAPLAEARSLAQKAGDRDGLGAAANALGLALLGAGRPSEAAEAFRDAAGAAPRTTRPEAYAMARANLALAYERLGRVGHARWAARAALAVVSVPRPVRLSAVGVLERLGRATGGVHEVMAGEPHETWSAIVRDELAILGAVDRSERRAEFETWIAVIASGDRGPDVAEALLGGLLELPPGDLDPLIAAMIDALGDRDEHTRERFVAVTSRALARFHIPQWFRLKDAFNHAAAQVGDDARWE